MNTIRQKYQALEDELNSTYSALKEDKKEFIFLMEEDIENKDFHEYFEVRGRHGIFDVHIIKVDENGIKIVESDDDNQRYYIGFRDLSDIQDRINLIELMQL